MVVEGGKTLYLLRHAKARKIEAGEDDKDRPLIRRGREAAAQLATWLAGRQPLPSVILCSPSARTRETLDVLRPALGEVAVDYDASLYGASAETLQAMIAKLPRDAAAAMIVGHNPGIEELAIDLAGHAPTRMLSRMREKFPTCALVILTAATRDWAKFSVSSRAEEFIRPIDLV
jgi:phosphohistidine phosphatase